MARGNAARNHEGAPPIPQRDDDSGKFRRKPGAPGAEEILDADAIGLVEEAEELNDADLEELPDELNPEDLELVEDEPQAVIESRASVKHPGRNEDAALGDLGRLLRERRTPPEIKTSMSQMDAARVTEAMEAEAKVADVLKSKRIFGVLDGISGAVKSPDGKTSKMNEGTGAVASRIASASLSERLAGMPDGATSAQAERLFAEALEDANQDIVQYRDKAYAPVMSTEARDLRKQELSQMGTTATLAMETKGPDGRRMMTIASVGDSRVYKYNRNTKKFSLLTTDENVAGFFLRQGRLDRAQYDLIMATRDPKTLPAELQAKFGKMSVNQAKNTVYKSLGSPDFTLEKGPNGNVFSDEIEDGDDYILTSDGLHDNISDERIKEILDGGGSFKDVEKEAFALSQTAEGKPDDITYAEIPTGRAGAPASGNPETARLQQAHLEARTKADSYKALLAKLDSGDAAAEAAVKPDGRDALQERMLVAEKRALETELKLLESRGDSQSSRHTEIGLDLRQTEEELKRHLKKHEDALLAARAGLDELYGEAGGAKKGGAAAESPSAAQPKKKGFFSGFFGGGK